jgi:hypothetical protein
MADRPVAAPLPAPVVPPPAPVAPPVVLVAPPASPAPTFDSQQTTAA